MHRLIQEKIADIDVLCHRYHVRSLEVFGSAARGESFDPTRSDIDFLVQFETRTGLSPLEEFFGLQTDLSRLLERPVDLIEVGAIRNPYVLASINRAREVVYAA